MNLSVAVFHLVGDQLVYKDSTVCNDKGVEAIIPIMLETGQNRTEGHFSRLVDAATVQRLKDEVIADERSRQLQRETALEELLKRKREDSCSAS